MKVLSGHITATEKKHIKAILTANIMEGRIGRKNYFLTLENGIYTVKIQQNDRGLGFVGSELRKSVYTHKFSI